MAIFLPRMAVYGWLSMGTKSAFWVDGKAGRGTRRRLKTKQGKAEDVLWGNKGRRGTVVYLCCVTWGKGCRARCLRVARSHALKPDVYVVLVVCKVSIEARACRCFGQRYL